MAVVEPGRGCVGWMGDVCVNEPCPTKVQERGEEGEFRGRRVGHRLAGVSKPRAVYPPSQLLRHPFLSNETGWLSLLLPPLPTPFIRGG